MDDMVQDTASRQLLVDMLREAAKLEQCLLNAYLAAACSVRSTPQEFASAGGDKENRRRAVHFERVRGWKRAIMGVAHEEMRHLHFVHCLLRALGEPACFELPGRTPDGVWTIPNWRIQAGAPVTGEAGVEVPVRPLDLANVQRFVLYEASDSLQDENPFGPDAMRLFGLLHEFEMDFRLAGILAPMPAGPEKSAMMGRLRRIYQELTPVQRVAEVKALAAAVSLPTISDIRFQSIADFYLRGILPLYEQAFDSGWVVANDRNLVDEQLNPDYAAEGFLPIGPVGRSAKFARFAKANQANPLADYKRVSDIVREIVEEGEGAASFRYRAERMLGKIEEVGVDGFLGALKADSARARDPDYVTPEWLAEAQLLRESHLYVFAMIVTEYELEQALARQSGVQFAAARSPVAITAPGLRELADALPSQFNACYCAMLAWMSRMYEPRQWAADTPRRMAIEMIATWPLMSVAIRPFLELASFFPIDWNRLFRIDRDNLPILPIWAQELALLWNAPARSEAINERMDYLIVRTLRAAADWARDQFQAVDSAGLPPHETQMIRTRLTALTRLVEFERQYPYRVAGGYSDRLPNLTYQNTHKDNQRYEESPAYNTVFADTLVLRLRFNGWGLVQLATDPDPPTDEAGCSGTLMLHAADGDRRFDRAIVWQNLDPERNIFRPIAEGGPPFGVNVLEASLMAPAPGLRATAGYLPLQVMSSTGAVQTSGLQQDLGVTGLFPLASLDAAQIMGGNRPRLRVFLESKDGVRPYLYGENHLVWQDGEPIDPFMISVYADEDNGAPARLLFRREIFNLGLPISAMDPFQRLQTSRGPCGFDSPSNIPDWAITDALRALLAAPNFPLNYLQIRSASLIEQIQQKPDGPDLDQAAVDQIVSLSERLLLVAQPLRTTIGWLGALLHYGHTVSGTQEVDSGVNPVLTALSASTGLGLQIAAAAADRSAPNARWLAGYTKGVMDTDALSDFVYGELFIPLAATSTGPITLKRSWTFAPEMAGPLGAVGTSFDRPFWGQFTVNNDTRSQLVSGVDPSDRSRSVTLTDRLTSRGEMQYAYVTSGFPSLASLSGSFIVAATQDQASLTWNCQASGTDAAALVTCASWFAATGDAMEHALKASFSPR